MKIAHVLNLALGLALPLALASCGGDNIFGNLDMTAACQGVPTLFKIQGGNYTISNTAIVADTCQTGTTSASFDGMARMVTNDANGTITVAGSAGNPNPLGAGTVSCNVGKLTLGDTIIQDSTNASCTYHISRTSTLTAIADNDFKLNFTESRSGLAMACMPNTDCTFSFSIQLRKQ